VRTNRVSPLFLIRPPSSSECLFPPPFSSFQTHRAPFIFPQIYLPFFFQDMAVPFLHCFPFFSRHPTPRAKCSLPFLSSVGFEKTASFFQMVVLLFNGKNVAPGTSSLLSLPNRKSMYKKGIGLSLLSKLYFLLPFFERRSERPLAFSC